MRSLSNADSRAKQSAVLRSAKSTQDLSSTNQKATADDVKQLVSEIQKTVEMKQATSLNVNLFFYKAKRCNFMEFVIITGMSGAGKTGALHVLEDIGYYCVDNLPSSLLSTLYRLCLKSEDDSMKRVAVVVDVRGNENLRKCVLRLNTSKRITKM